MMLLLAILGTGAFWAVLTVLAVCLVIFVVPNE